MENCKLFVGNLPYSAEENDLQELFSEHGAVKEINLITNKGFGFIEMGTPEEAKVAKEALNHAYFGGRNINVDEARPMKPRPKRNFRSY